MIRLFVIDDHPVVRAGLVAALEDDEGFQVVGAAASYEEALPLIGSHHPDVILLDLELPGTGGLQAIPQLVEAFPGIRILIFTAYDTDDRVLGAIRSGARGYLLKGAPMQEIGRAIRTVHAGESYLQPRIASKVLAQLDPRKQATALSQRQLEVLRLVAEGQTNRQIAVTLHISERTAKFHVTTLMKKLGADNRAHAVALASERGLI
jgi:DNA-binding NarL/FixJ family response regulator